ncbi:MAG: hypothetical protein ACLFMX_02595 [Halobacteriales archaeon]
MPSPATLRDSTQIEVPYHAVAHLLETIETRFVVTIRREGSRCRIIGSPVEIKDVGTYLARRGVTVP